MQILIKDILRLKPLQGLKLLTKPGGLDNAVSKVGTLEYELTMQGRAFCSEEHWERGEFVLTTFQYARENPQLITGAVKKMVQAHTSGLALKNVYQLEIPKEAIQYANAHGFPIFTFTDHDLYFEDVILAVYQLLQSQRDFEKAGLCANAQGPAFYHFRDFCRMGSESETVIDQNHKVPSGIPGKTGDQNIAAD